MKKYILTFVSLMILLSFNIFAEDITENVNINGENKEITIHNFRYYITYDDFRNIQVPENDFENKKIHLLRNSIQGISILEEDFGVPGYPYIKVDFDELKSKLVDESDYPMSSNYGFRVNFNDEYFEENKLYYFHKSVSSENELIKKIISNDFGLVTNGIFYFYEKQSETEYNRHNFVVISNIYESLFSKSLYQDFIKKTVYESYSGDSYFEGIINENIGLVVYKDESGAILDSHIALGINFYKTLFDNSIGEFYFRKRDSNSTLDYKIKEVEEKTVLINNYYKNLLFLDNFEKQNLRVLEVIMDSSETTSDDLRLISEGKYVFGRNRRIDGNDVILNSVPFFSYRQDFSSRFTTNEGIIVKESDLGLHSFYDRDFSKTINKNVFIEGINKDFLDFLDLNFKNDFGDDGVKIRAIGLYFGRNKKSEQDIFYKFKNINGKPFLVLEFSNLESMNDIENLDIGDFRVLSVDKGDPYKVSGISGDFQDLKIYQEKNIKDFSLFYKSSKDDRFKIAKFKKFYYIYNEHPLDFYNNTDFEGLNKIEDSIDVFSLSVKDDNVYLLNPLNKLVIIELSLSNKNEFFYKINEDFSVEELTGTSDDLYYLFDLQVENSIYRYFLDKNRIKKISTNSGDYFYKLSDNFSEFLIGKNNTTEFKLETKAIDRLLKKAFEVMIDTYIEKPDEMKYILRMQKEYLNKGFNFFLESMLQIDGGIYDIDEIISKIEEKDFLRRFMNGEIISSIYTTSDMSSDREIVNSSKHLNLGENFIVDKILEGNYIKSTSLLPTIINLNKTKKGKDTNLENHPNYILIKKIMNEINSEVSYENYDLDYMKNSILAVKNEFLPKLVKNKNLLSNSLPYVKDNSLENGLEIFKINVEESGRNEFTLSLDIDKKAESKFINEVRKGKENLLKIYLDNKITPQYYSSFLNIFNPSYLVEIYEKYNSGVLSLYLFSGLEYKDVNFTDRIELKNKGLDFNLKGKTTEEDLMEELVLSSKKADINSIRSLKNLDFMLNKTYIFNPEYHVTKADIYHLLETGEFHPITEKEYQKYLLELKKDWVPEFKILEIKRDISNSNLINYKDGIKNLPPNSIFTLVDKIYFNSEDGKYDLEAYVRTQNGKEYTLFLPVLIYSEKEKEDDTKVEEEIEYIYETEYIYEEDIPEKSKIKIKDLKEWMKNSFKKDISSTKFLTVKDLVNLTSKILLKDKIKQLENEKEIQRIAIQFKLINSDFLEYPNKIVTIYDLVEILKGTPIQNSKPLVNLLKSKKVIPTTEEILNVLEKSF